LGLIYILLSLLLILCWTAQDYQIHLYYLCFKAQYNAEIMENEPRKTEGKSSKQLNRSIPSVGVSANVLIFLHSQLVVS